MKKNKYWIVSIVAVVVIVLAVVSFQRLGVIETVKAPEEGSKGFLTSIIDSISKRASQPAQVYSGAGYPGTGNSKLSDCIKEVSVGGDLSNPYPTLGTRVKVIDRSCLKDGMIFDLSLNEVRKLYQQGWVNSKAAALPVGWALVEYKFTSGGILKANGIIPPAFSRYPLNQNYSTVLLIYKVGTQITAVATPNANMLFLRWNFCPSRTGASRDVLPLNGPCLFKIEKQRTLYEVEVEFLKNGKNIQVGDYYFGNKNLVTTARLDTASTTVISNNLSTTLANLRKRFGPEYVILGVNYIGRGHYDYSDKVHDGLLFPLKIKYPVGNEIYYDYITITENYDVFRKGTVVNLSLYSSAGLAPLITVFKGWNGCPNNKASCSVSLNNNLGIIIEYSAYETDSFGAIIGSTTTQSNPITWRHWGLR